MRYFLLGILILLCNTYSFADINAADKGDIVIFNRPLEADEIKVQLFYCSKNESPCRDWVAIAPASPALKPGTYYVFDMIAQQKLENLEIAAKVYSVLQKTWSAPLPLITHYKYIEEPFYQYICWAQSKASFFCEGGEIADSQSIWSRGKKLLAQMINFSILFPLKTRG